uniref:Uncharacterized protein MANES_01G265800 n=1 Tax=Rhizophora mucronata TaxID=61149 RepID=A0A2P2JJ49_RHIMU
MRIEIVLEGGVWNFIICPWWTFGVIVVSRCQCIVYSVIRQLESVHTLINGYLVVPFLIFSLSMPFFGSLLLLKSA